VRFTGGELQFGGIVTDSEHQSASEMFVADITELVVTGLNDDATKLVIESWTTARGLTVVERD